MYKELKRLVYYYLSVLNLMEQAGVESPETEAKLDLCFYLLGRK